MILTCTLIVESNSVFVVHLQGENSCLSLDSTIGGQNRPTIVQCQQYEFKHLGRKHVYPKLSYAIPSRESSCQISVHSD